MNIPNNLDPTKLYAHTLPDMVPVALPHLNAICDFLLAGCDYNGAGPRVPQRVTEPMVAWLRNAYADHQSKKVDAVKREEGLAKHAAMTRAATLAKANGDEKE